MLIRRCVLFTLLSLAPLCRAQIPDTVVLLKVTEYQQDSATHQTATAYDYDIRATFSAPLPAGVTVQFWRGDGHLNLFRNSDGTVYSATSQYPAASQIDGIFADGEFTLNVVDGAKETRTLMNVVNGPRISSVLITNYDALQSAPSATGTLVKWQQIPEALTADEPFLSLTGVGPNNATYPTTDTFVGTETQGHLGGPLPLGVKVTGHLGFIMLTSSTQVNNKATTVLVGTGWDVAFPVVFNLAKPQISLQPKDAVLRAGEALALTGGAFESSHPDGSTVTYQWYKDSAAISGATKSGYTVAVAKPSDAGSYYFVASDSAGSTTSNTATVIVGSGLDLTTFAGSGTKGTADGQGKAAQFNAPSVATVDSHGNVYVIDDSGTTIRKVTSTGAVSTLAGSPGQSGSTDGTGAAARFNNPQGLAVASDGTVFVADTDNDTIRKITSDGAVTTYAGQAGTSADVDGARTSARFKQPKSIAIDSSGNLYVADTTSNAIRKIAADGTVSTFAGGTAGTDADGVGTSAILSQPVQVVFGGDGLLYVGELGNDSKLRVITADAHVTTVARPWSAGFAVDAAGTIYNPMNGYVTAQASNGIVTSIGGGNANGASSANDAFGVAAYLGAPTSVVIDSAGTFWIVDQKLNVLRKGVFVAGTPHGGITITSQPQPATIASGATVVLSAPTTGLNVSGTWLKDGVALSSTGSTLVIANAGSANAGNYTFLAQNAAGGIATTPAAISVVDTSNPGRLANLSIRTTAGTDAQTLIVGFTIGGTGNTPKRILLRGVGPGMAPFGVSNLVADPVVTLYSGQQAIATNDDWDNGIRSTFGPVGAFPLPAGSHDAAMVSSLGSGQYSAQITGKSSTGIALAEAYDLDDSTNTLRLINLSARAQIGTGDNVLIAGFAILGDTAKTVLIRGIGPSLGAFGVPGTIANPKLELYYNRQVIASNDDWGGSTVLKTISQSVNAFGLASATSADSVLLLTLPPGSYSATVSGVGDTTGVGMVEVYEVP